MLTQPSSPVTAARLKGFFYHNADLLQLLRQREQRCYLRPSIEHPDDANVVHLRRSDAQTDDGGTAPGPDVWPHNAVFNDLKRYRHGTDAVALLMELNYSHRASLKPFAVSATAMARDQVIAGWGRRCYTRARKLLVERGYIRQVTPLRRDAQGNWTPPKYTFAGQLFYVAPVPTPPEAPSAKSSKLALLWCHHVQKWSIILRELVRLLHLGHQARVPGAEVQSSLGPQQGNAQRAEVPQDNKEPSLPLLSAPSSVIL